MAAKFHEHDTDARLAKRRALSGFLDALIKAHRPELSRISLTYIFCNDAYLHSINLQFLQHDDYTDIITFDLSESADELKGEIYISVERVADNAVSFGTEYNRELHRVIFHGTLHLCGLRDKTAAEQQTMRSAEDEALRDWDTQKPQRRT